MAECQSTLMQLATRDREQALLLQRQRTKKATFSGGFVVFDDQS
jgi:hypothetical protein